MMDSHEQLDNLLESNQNENKHEAIDDASLISNILPDELILTILSYLSFKDLVALNVVSKNMARLSSDERLWNMCLKNVFGDFNIVSHDPKKHFVMLFTDKRNAPISMVLVDSITGYLRITESSFNSNSNFFSSRVDTRQVYINFMKLNLCLEDSDSETSTVCSEDELNKGISELDLDEDEVNFDLIQEDEEQQVVENILDTETELEEIPYDNFQDTTQKIDTRIIALQASYILLNESPASDINLVGQPFNQAIQHYFAAIGDIIALKILMDAGSDMTLEDAQNNSAFTLLIQHCIDNDLYNEANDEHSNYKVFLRDLLLNYKTIPYTQIYNVFSRKLDTTNRHPGNLDLFYFITALSYGSGQLTNRELDHLKELYEDINDEVFDEHKFNNIVKENTKNIGQSYRTIANLTM